MKPSINDMSIRIILNFSLKQHVPKNIKSSKSNNELQKFIQNEKVEIDIKKGAQISIVAKIINPWLCPFVITRSTDLLAAKI